MTKKESDTSVNTFIWAIIIIVIVIAFILTLGAFYKTESNDNKFESIEDKIKKAKEKHKRLEEHLKKKKELKIKLEKKFFRIYLTIRILIISIMVSYNFIFWKMNLVNSVGDFVDINEVVVLIFGLMIFLVSREFKGLDEMISYTKNLIENKVYGKYVTLDDRIICDETELKKIGSEIKEMEQKKLTSAGTES